MPARRLKTSDQDFAASLDALLYWDTHEADEVTRIASEIISGVRARGDVALLEYTRRFDRFDADSVAALQIAPERLARKLDELPGDDRKALENAAARIRAYHQAQLDDGFEIADEMGCFGQRVTPLDRVGVYVPGGQAAYPSTVLMTVVPAKVAGVSEVIVTVPTPDGVQNDHVLAALALSGADRINAVGGAVSQCRDSLRTETMPGVDKIVGPGGAFVAAAKRLVFGPVGIDGIAGPSEILIVADGSVAPGWTALDLCSQAEHDATAQAVLLCPDAGYLDEIEAEMSRLLPTLSRRNIIEASLTARGALIETVDLEEAVEIANRIAPEHLQLAVADPDALLPNVRHAGAIFLGGYSAEVIGDYSAGPSHVLPTFGTARYASPLDVRDFQKRSSVIRCTPDGADVLGKIAARIATAEGLDAHARSALARTRGDNENI
ncbi:MAG: histidinol dehydrogenase [Gammaproteobacteria bacterium]|nr:histidinol dehydrogenase [Gammaproteobacteria bacterium]